ncbi:MAG: hypothetical protein Q7R39_19130 [Dehalococcoidia bacterium]|nr:hypothetical protein [Dehalococcoidia bacterium]
MTVVMVVGFAWAAGVTAAAATVGLDAAAAVAAEAGAACVGLAAAGALVGAGVGDAADKQDAANEVNKSVDPMIQAVAFQVRSIITPPSSASLRYL